MNYVQLFFQSHSCLFHHYLPSSPATANQLAWQKSDAEPLDTIAGRESAESYLVGFEELGGQVAIKMVVIEDAEKKGDAWDQYALQAT